MSEQEIIEGNRLIAGFMGYSLITPEMRNNPEKWYIKGKPSCYWENHSLKSSKKVLCSEFDLQYHSNWSWLMPVVERIEEGDFWVNIKKNHVTVAWDNKNTLDSKMIHSEFGDYSKIERVYMCVISFIKWYNNKKQNVAK